MSVTKKVVISSLRLSVTATATLIIASPAYAGVADLERTKVAAFTRELGEHLDPVSAAPQFRAAHFGLIGPIGRLCIRYPKLCTQVPTLTCRKLPKACEALVKERERIQHRGKQAWERLRELMDEVGPATKRQPTSEWATRLEAIEAAMKEQAVIQQKVATDQGAAMDDLVRRQEMIEKIVRDMLADLLALKASKRETQSTGKKPAGCAP